jgi:hypothetical protein
MGFRQENSLRANFYIRAVLANFGWETPDIRKKHNEPFQNGFFFWTDFGEKCEMIEKESGVIWWGFGQPQNGCVKWFTTWYISLGAPPLYRQTQNLTKQIRAEKFTCGPEFLPGQKLRTALG